jgi:Ca-activated chloride channel family protein
LNAPQIIAPQIILTPRRPAVLAGFQNTFDVLVRVAAPDAPPSVGHSRAPLHLALVIDRSGSMSGQPLEEAKKAAAFVINGLMRGDRASLVTYDDAVDTRVPLHGAEDRDTLLRASAGIQSGGMTNLHGGWFAGAETLAPAVSRETISRVILLSDGCANRGLTDPEAIYRQCAELAGTGVTTSTYGLGQNFNEDLMIGMARAGLGNTYYGQTAADLMDPFREEFALLNATCARRLELELVPAPGVQAEVLNDYPLTDDGNTQLPDLAYGGEAWALVRLKVPAGPEGANPAALLTAALRYRDMAGEPRAVQPCALSLPAVAAAAYETLIEDPLVIRRASELEAARLLLQARAAARRRDWDQVQALLASASKLGADNPWLKDVVRELQQLADRRDDATFAKEGAYSSRRMTTRLASAAEGVVPGDEKASYLRRKSAQGKQQPDSPDKR